MPTNNRRIKLTKLLELLRQESDSEHPMTTKTIVDTLKASGVPANRRLLPLDIETLIEQGFEVMRVKIGKENAYYIEDRSFSIPELKILIDAVQAASFITPKKTDELIAKIAFLGGSHQAEILEDNIVRFNTRKHSNERIYYNVDALERALQTRHKVIFLYYDLNENMEKIYRRGGHHYVIEPISLVFLEDNYYVMAYDSRFDKVTNYRVDRMEKIDIIDDEISEEALAKVDVGKYTAETFKMYNGEASNVTLEFDDSLIGAVYDKFGEDIKMLRTDEHLCVTSVRVNVSPTFFGWVFQFSDKMRILSPENVVGAYKEHYNKVYISKE